MDLSKHVIVPTDEFLEMQTATWDQPPMSVKERAISTANVTIVVGVLGSAIVACSWGVAKVLDWREERVLQRRMREQTFAQTPTPS